jgi:hypothetical protein
MTKKQVLKKARPFFGLIIMVLLICLCSLVVFFSVYSALVLPLLWMIFTALHQFRSKSKKITYLWNASRFSMWVYFSSLFVFFIYTPNWMKILSVQLENKSLVNVFKEGTFMYGRTSVAFALAAAVFILFLLHYRWSQNQKADEQTSALTEQ